MMMVFSRTSVMVLVISHVSPTRLYHVLSHVFVCMRRFTLMR